MGRLLGIHTQNLPTKKAKTVAAADFTVAALIGHFERRYDRAFAVSNPQDARAIIGDQVLSSQYGWDGINGFFANLSGVPATLYLVPHVGWTGSAIDAVMATKSFNDTDGTPEPILKVDAAYQNNAEYGVSGNRTGVTVELGSRFVTAANGAGMAADTFALLDSVAGIKLGDLVKFVATGGGGGTVFKKITGVDESLGRVTFSGAFHATANLADGDAVTVPGFRVRIWRKGIGGLVQEVEPTLGKAWLTTEVEVADYYAPNVFAAHGYAKLSVLTTTSALEFRFPAAVATVTYLESGADGTAPTTAAHWARALLRLDNLPVRMLCLNESTDAAIQKSVETYCKGREDNPKAILAAAEDRTKAQLVTIGNNLQRSDDVMGLYFANWLGVSDPFNTSPQAPTRHVPNGGHVMGLWCRTIGQRGTHWVPATMDNPLFGAVEVIGDQFLNDQDRTDLAAAGANVIQSIPGVGVVVRNFRTLSTTKEFVFANGVLTREFIKASAKESLQGSEGAPNTFDAIKADAMAIQQFLLRLWDAGPYGASPRGEFFGKSFRADGSETKATDHFEVVADVVNNPVSSIEAGNRNVHVYFSYPAPTESIVIGVGILLRG